MITGNEGVYAAYSINDKDNGRAQDGITLRQLALKDFMCAMIASGIRDMKDANPDHIPQAVAEAANVFTDAYINQLNKQL